MVVNLRMRLKETEKLYKVNRTQIHFTAGENNDRNIFSGHAVEINRHFFKVGASQYHFTLFLHTFLPFKFLHKEKQRIVP